MIESKRTEFLAITSTLGELPTSAPALGEAPGLDMLDKPEWQGVRLAVDLRGLARVEQRLLDDARVLLGALAARARQREG